MAFKHGMDTVFKLDDSGGTLRDLSAYVNNVDGLPGDAEVAETTTFGSGVVNKTHLRGPAGASFSITGNWDSTATSGPDVVLSGLRTSASTATFEFGPEGSAGGSIKYTGECLCTNYKITAPVADVVTFSADFTVTGAVTRTTF